MTRVYFLQFKYLLVAKSNLCWQTEDYFLDYNLRMCGNIYGAHVASSQRVPVPKIGTHRELADLVRSSAKNGAAAWGHTRSCFPAWRRRFPNQKHRRCATKSSLTGGEVSEPLSAGWICTRGAHTPRRNFSRLRLRASTHRFYEN